ncbi:MAG: hypothetical protein ABI955_02370, partial [Nitrospirota bacterium]
PRQSASLVGAVANLYNRTNPLTEKILRDLLCSDAVLTFWIREYFNPADLRFASLLGKTPTCTE